MVTSEISFENLISGGTRQDLDNKKQFMKWISVYFLQVGKNCMLFSTFFVLFFMKKYEIFGVWTLKFHLKLSGCMKLRNICCISIISRSFRVEILNASTQLQNYDKVERVQQPDKLKNGKISFWASNNGIIKNRNINLQTGILTLFGSFLNIIVWILVLYTMHWYVKKLIFLLFNHFYTYWTRFITRNNTIALTTIIPDCTKLN